MRILFVTLHDILGKINNGGNQCTDRNLQLLQKIYGEECVDLCVGVEDISKWEARDRIYVMPLLKSRGAKLLAGLMLRSDLTKRAEQIVYQLAGKNKYSIIFFDNTRFGRIIQKIEKNKDIQSRIVVFAHNVEKNILWQRVINENKLCLPLYIATEYCESLSLKYSNMFWALSKRDGDIFRSAYGRNPDFILPITFTNQHRDGSVCDILPERSLLFIGSDYRPNVQGIQWFCKNVMPQLDIPLFIVGRGLEKLREELDNDIVKTIGSVDNISEYLQAAGAVVMPIFYGSGMKVKTAEAIMHGKRIFATTEALAGYETAERGITCCDNAEGFIKAIRHYVDEEGIQREIREVRELFWKYYDTESYIEPARKLLEGNDV